MNLIKIFTFILISLNISIKANSIEIAEGLLKKGGNLILIRHAYAPGNGDPSNFDINDCSTQRNLNREGIIESQTLGKFFLKNKIKIDKVLSSEWCRCKDTAFYAFKNYEEVSFLNSFYDKKFFHNKLPQMARLKKYIKNWKSTKNLVLVTHYVVISELLNVATSPAEIIVTDKNFNILGRKKVEDN